MTDDEHRELARVLHEVKGKVVLSSYHCDLMNELYGDWRYIEGLLKKVHSVKQLRMEVLWVNYDLEEEIECQHQQRYLIAPTSEPLFTLQNQ